jgi:hypothetical protein
VCQTNEAAMFRFYSSPTQNVAAAADKAAAVSPVARRLLISSAALITSRHTLAHSECKCALLDAEAERLSNEQRTARLSLSCELLIISMVQCRVQLLRRVCALSAPAADLEHSRFAKR